MEQPVRMGKMGQMLHAKVFSSSVSARLIQVHSEALSGLTD